jgi:hypothetical protein
MTPEVEASHLLGIVESLAKVHEWQADLTGSQPSPKAVAQPGSDLKGDDDAVSPYQVSHAVWMAMLAATDHLTCLEATFFQAGPLSAQMHLHIYAQLTLVRAGFENASHAVWLLEPDNRRERILRRLRQEYSELRDLDRVRRAAGEQPGLSLGGRLADLAVLGQPFGIETKEIRNKPENSAIVEAAGSRIGLGPIKALVIWKACSAIAHGEVRGTLAYLSKQIVGGTWPDVALSKVTGNLTLLHAGIDAAVETLAVAHILYARRSGHRKEVRAPTG